MCLLASDFCEDIFWQRRQIHWFPARLYMALSMFSGSTAASWKQQQNTLVSLNHPWHHLLSGSQVNLDRLPDDLQDRIIISYSVHAQTPYLVGSGATTKLGGRHIRARFNETKNSFSTFHIFPAFLIKYDDIIVWNQVYHVRFFCLLSTLWNRRHH